MTGNRNCDRNNSASDNSKNILGAGNEELVNYPISSKEIRNIEDSISIKNRVLWTIAIILELIFAITGGSGIMVIGDNQSEKEKKKRAKRRKRT